MKKILMIVAAILALAVLPLALFGCNKGSETEAPTGEPTEVPTEAPKSGCGSVVGFGAVAALAAAAAFVACKKD